MSMTWPWRERTHSISIGGWLRESWLALVGTHHLAAADGEPSRTGAFAVGDQRAAFEAFFLRYDRQITSYLWRMTGDEQTASELAQETFLRAWQHFEVIRQYDQPVAWLFRVATNLARQYHRRRTAPVGMATALDAENDPAGSDPTLHFVEQDLVRQTLLQLPIHQRAALILREVYGLSCAEIADLLGMSPSAVKMALWRAREQFRVRYLREEEA
jgi:RNA polymerase sigma-70 factor (ECF subfamily)